MLIVPAGVKVHLALGYTDMRKGMDGLAMLVQETLKKDPFICGGTDYVAARPLNLRVQPSLRVRRYIIFRCCPAAVRQRPWGGNERCGRQPRRPCRGHGASSQRLRRRSGAWWRPVNDPARPG
jgi:hypothetical protein